MAYPEHGMDHLLFVHGEHQRLCGQLLQYRRMGQFQNLGLCLSLDFHHRNRVLYCKEHPLSQNPD